jgi:hypothetical protein
MPATGFRYGAKASVVINSVDLSTFSDDAGLTIDVDAAETTSFGSTYKSFIEGLAASKFTLKGQFDPTTTTGPAAALTALIGTGAHTLVFSPAGTVSLELKRTVSAILTNYGESSPVGGKVSFSAAFQGTGAVTFAAN